MVFHSNFCNVFEFVFEVLTNQLFVNYLGPTDFYVCYWSQKFQIFELHIYRLASFSQKGQSQLMGLSSRQLKSESWLSRSELGMAICVNSWLKYLLLYLDSLLQSCFEMPGERVEGDDYLFLKRCFLERSSSESDEFCEQISSKS